MQFTAKQLGLIFGIILLVVLLLLGTSPAGKRMSAGFIRPFAETKKYVSDQTSTLFAGNTQKEQIARLESRLRELELNERSVTELKLENSQLRQMLSMRPFPVWNIIRAEVLTRDPVFWDSRFTIDRGEADGIAIGSAVLFGDAIDRNVAIVYSPLHGTGRWPVPRALREAGFILVRVFGACVWPWALTGVTVMFAAVTVRYAKTVYPGLRAMRRSRRFPLFACGVALMLFVSQSLGRAAVWQKLGVADAVGFGHFIEESVELFGYLLMFVWAAPHACRALRRRNYLV